MWISYKDDWDPSHTNLSKYFIERIKQSVDYEEIISNRHRTTNGFTLIAEIVEVAKLAQKRIKSVHRLMSLVNESNSSFISSSIKNDYILTKYHSDIVEYYAGINTGRLKDNGSGLLSLINKSKIHFERLYSNYYENILWELKQIDFNSDEFNRNARTIDSLINCLVPYLLHIGYSVTSISDIAYRYIRKTNGDSSPIRIVDNFSNKIRKFQFLIKVESQKEEIYSILEYLDIRNVTYKKVKTKDISDSLFENFRLKKNQDLYLIDHKTIDPHNYLRNVYDLGLKKHVAHKDRLSLDFFTNFFDNVYWRFDTVKHKFQTSENPMDPINIPKRKSTLIETLETLKRSFEYKFSKEEGIPYIHDLRDSIYYYNLALGSKSIENSLSLLWTSLETLLPYRLKSNDIENVQHFVSKSLSIGSIGRQITAFAIRFKMTDKINNDSLKELGIYTSYINFKPEGIKKWVEWLSTEFEDETDPFSVLKDSSNLLCNTFCQLNDTFTGKNGLKVDYWLDKIRKSETSISHQLDRIYLHRNQIVHSGKFINEYSNLWNHLEWYVGKLLSYAVLNFILLEDRSKFNKENIFMKLEADADMVTNLLENHKEKNIKDIHFAFPMITKETWQFF